MKNNYVGILTVNCLNCRHAKVKENCCDFIAEPVKAWKMGQCLYYQEKKEGRRQ